LGGEHGIGLLESALAEPRQTFYGKFLRRTVFDKAAALFRSLIKNHPLVDGNKRLALTAAFVFLRINNYAFYVPYNEAVDMALRVASGGAEPTVEELSRWFRRNSFNLAHLDKRQPPIWLQREFGPLLRRMRARLQAEAKSRNALV
jgi:death-on-curing protein